MHYRLFSLFENSPRNTRGGGLTSTPPILQIAVSQPIALISRFSEICLRTDSHRKFLRARVCRARTEYRTIAYEVFYIYDSKFIQ